MEQQWEEAEKILSWREMRPGVYRYHDIERRGTNNYGRPISVITLETEEGVKMYYAPASLFYDLKRRSETIFIKYEGTQTSEKGYEYPVFKFTKWINAFLHNKKKDRKFKKILFANWKKINEWK